jgi:threonine aldolase
MVDRLAEDHRNARILAEGVSRLPGVTVDLATVQTNIVIFSLPTAAKAEAFMTAAAGAGVLLSDFGAGRLRMVTHYGITEDDCREAVGALARCAAA